MTGVEMRHVSAVSHLDAGFRPFGVNCIRHFLHLRYDLIIDIELSVKRHAAQIHGTICYGGHTYSTACNGNMIILQFLRRPVRPRHILKSRAADDSVPQRDRP